MISIILVEPESSGNIGSTARVIKNFGFEELILINPKCDYKNEECAKFAKNAQEIIKNIKIYKDLGEIKKEFDTLIATTSQLGTDYNISRTPITPEQLTKLDLKGSIALIFGRESSGLTNKEIKKCDFLVTIPTSRDYPALNLSHSITIILYELSKNKENITSHIRGITRTELEQIEKRFDQILDKLDFATPEKKQTQKSVWSKIFAKSFLSKREAFAVIGLLKKIAERIK